MIRLSPVRLIDENNEQVGVVETDEAKRMARAAGLDLVEVAPQARPPVCRIMDYGKWKYQQRKKEQKAKSHAKQSELKGIRLRPGTDEHDLQIKTNKARDFLEDGDKVQFTMLFRGRQMAHQDLGLRSMQEIYQGLSDIAKIEAAPRMMGRRMTMVLAPDRKSHQQPKPSGGKGGKSGQGKAAASKPDAGEAKPAETEASEAAPAPADREAEPAKSS